MYKPEYVYHGSQYRFDIVKPQQACGANTQESLMAIYAADSIEKVISFVDFYEEKGLINPERNIENGYREYSDTDVAILKKIIIFISIRYIINHFIILNLT